MWQPENCRQVCEMGRKGCAYSDTEWGYFIDPQNVKKRNSYANNIRGHTQEVAVSLWNHIYATLEGIFVCVCIYVAVEPSSEAVVEQTPYPHPYPSVHFQKHRALLGSGPVSALEHHRSWWHTTGKQSQISGHPGPWEGPRKRNAFDHLIAALAQSLVRVKVKIVGLNQCPKLTLN